MGHYSRPCSSLLQAKPHPKSQASERFVGNSCKRKKAWKPWVFPQNPNLPPLAVKLKRQKTKKNYHGLYDYVQIDLTYSSSRMASNRLTRGQVETIFRKGKVRESFEPLKVSDLVEVMNHCVCIDYVLDHVSDPLSQKLIQDLHYKLMFGTVDHRKELVNPGVYSACLGIHRFRCPVAEGQWLSVRCPVCVQ